MPKDTKSLTDAMTDALRGQSRLLENALGKSGPVSLTFDEFCILLPERMTRVNSNAQLADWFTLVDRDNDGAATLYEFFLWALGVASGASASLADSSTGSGAAAVFRKYDLDGSGRLDQEEFEKAAQDLGFGKRSSELFRVMPLLPDGTVDYHPVLQRVHALANSRAMKSFLAAAAWDESHTKSVGKSGIDTSGWRFTGDDPEAARTGLKALLDFHDCQLWDVFKDMDIDGDQTLTQTELVNAFTQTLGFDGLPVVVYQIFDQLDADSSGKIGFNELEAWVNGKKLEAEWRSETFRKKDENHEWDELRLRKEILTILNKEGMDVGELVKSWDPSGDGTLSRRELLMNMKKYVDEELWYASVRTAVMQAYALIDTADDGSVSIDELMQWLHLGPDVATVDGKSDAGALIPAVRIFGVMYDLSNHSIRDPVTKLNRSKIALKKPEKTGIAGIGTPNGPSRQKTGLKPKRSPPPLPGSPPTLTTKPTRAAPQKPEPRYARYFPEWIDIELRERRANRAAAGLEPEQQSPRVVAPRASPRAASPGMALMSSTGAALMSRPDVPRWRQSPRMLPPASPRPSETYEWAAKLRSPHARAMLKNGSVYNWTAWTPPETQAELARARLSPRGRPPRQRLSAAQEAYFAHMSVRTPQLVAEALL